MTIQTTPEPSMRPDTEASEAGAARVSHGPAPSDRSPPEVLRVVAAVALAALFIYAAIPKILDPAGFVSDIRNFRMAPWWALNAFALLLPWWELLAGIAILIPSWRRAGAVMMFLMSCVFFVAVAQAVKRGLDIGCGCFGHGDTATKVGLQHLMLNLAMIIASLYVACGRARTSREM